MAQTAAIVTTLKHPGASLDSFLRYHIAIGFSKFFLFFDDPHDPAIQTARNFRQAAVVRHGPALQRQWAATEIAAENPGFYAFLKSEFKVRQTLNVEIAIGLALRQNIDWLLHIDCDELFYSPHGTAVEHFQMLSDRRLNNVIYANYEGIPETENIDDYFKRVTLFKKNFFLSPGISLSARQRAVIKPIQQIPAHLFLFYANGKSAARVTAALLPDGGHRFKYRKTIGGLAGHRPEKIRPVICDDALILHYPVCGFKNFLGKYQRLGAFPDRWFDQVDIKTAIGPFHLESRDVVALSDRELARSFYLHRVVISDPGVIQKLIDSGVASRIRDPRNFLRKTSRLLGGING